MRLPVPRSRVIIPALAILALGASLRAAIQHQAPSTAGQEPPTEFRIVRDTAQAITIELLKLSPDGVLTALASQPLPADPATRIRVPSASRAWVRFSTPERAPLTLRASELGEPSGWRLPELRAGGELFVWLEEGALAPQFYSLSGPFLANLELRGRHATFHGLPAGSYQVTPVYEGPSAPFRCRHDRGRAQRDGLPAPRAAGNGQHQGAGRVVFRRRAFHRHWTRLGLQHLETAG